MEGLHVKEKLPRLAFFEKMEGLHVKEKLLRLAFFEKWKDCM